MVDRRLQTGDWVRMGPGLYASSAAPATWRRQAKAAELSVAGAVVSHRGAAVLHQIPGFRPGAIDLTAPTDATSRSPFAVVHRRALIAATTVDGIATTTLARTVVDLAACVPSSTLGAVFDDLVVRRLLTVDDLRRERDVLAPTHCRGIGAVGSLLDDRVDGEVPAANELERVLRGVLADPRLPSVQHQAAFPWWPDAPNRVDAFLPAWRRIVEADGRRWHTREADFDRDRARDHLAQRNGYEVTRFTYRQLVEAPGYAFGVLLDIGSCAAA
jgi:very-short-patch-repair endonuclease